MLVEALESAITREVREERIPDEGEKKVKISYQPFLCKISTILVKRRTASQTKITR